jgi:hypothetical protein
MRSHSRRVRIRKTFVRVVDYDEAIKAISSNTTTNTSSEYISTMPGAPVALGAFVRKVRLGRDPLNLPRYALRPL